MKFGSVGTADSTQVTRCVPRASSSPGPSPGAALAEHPDVDFAVFGAAGP
jgi:hypothetical protein